MILALWSSSKAIVQIFTAIERFFQRESAKQISYAPILRFALNTVSPLIYAKPDILSQGSKVELITPSNLSTTKTTFIIN